MTLTWSDLNGGAWAARYGERAIHEMREAERDRFQRAFHEVLAYRYARQAARCAFLEFHELLDDTPEPEMGLLQDAAQSGLRHGVVIGFGLAAVAAVAVFEILSRILR